MRVRCSYNGGMPDEQQDVDPTGPIVFYGELFKLAFAKPFRIVARCAGGLALLLGAIQSFGYLRSWGV